MVRSIISLEPRVQFSLRYNVLGPMDSAILLIIILSAVDKLHFALPRTISLILAQREISCQFSS